MRIEAGLTDMTGASRREQEQTDERSDAELQTDTHDTTDSTANPSKSELGRLPWLFYALIAILLLAAALSLTACGN